MYSQIGIVRLIICLIKMSYMIEFMPHARRIKLLRICAINKKKCLSIHLHVKKSWIHDYFNESVAKSI